MGPIGLPELISLFVLLLAPTALIVGIILIVTGRRKGKSAGPAGEMSCGGCGYSVRGLQQLTCPECGVDLRAAGITGGGSAAKRTVGIVLVVFSVLFMVSCCGLGLIGWLAMGNSTAVTTPMPVPVQPQPAPGPVDPNSAIDAPTPGGEGLEAPTE